MNVFRQDLTLHELDLRRQGNDKGARVLAKSLVRLRGQRTKVLASSAQLRGVRASIGVSAAEQYLALFMLLCKASCAVLDAFCLSTRGLHHASFVSRA